MCNQKQRDYLFDNYKVLLIVLVVMGHFIELSYKNNSFLYTVKWLIVSFHMPAFIFISGYFSKKKLPVGTLIRKLAVPYLVYEVIYYLLYIYVIGKPTGLYLLYPKFSLWYLQSLFIWRLLTPVIMKIPGYLVLSVIGGLLIGCVDMPSNFLSIPRTLVFFPFFLAGVRFDASALHRLRTRRNQIFAGAGILGFVLFLILDPSHKGLSPKIFYGRYNYDYLGQSAAEGLLCRIACYLISFFLTFAIALLISRKKTFYSYIGTRTMAVYLFHGLTYSLIKGTTDILENVNTLAESSLLLVFCVCLTALFAVPQFTTFTNAVSSLRIPQRIQLPRLRSYRSLNHPVLPLLK